MPFAVFVHRAIMPNATGQWDFACLTISLLGMAHAIEAHALERVAVVDFDVHHGNGTEDIFRNDPRVMMVSTIPASFISIQRHHRTFRAYGQYPAGGR